MKDEHIIVNKTAILKKIEELEKQKKNLEVDDFDNFNLIHAEINGLKFCLGQSIPFISEIKKAFNTGFHKGYGVGQGDAKNHPLALTIANHIHEERQNYISNLKLDI